MKAWRRCQMTVWIEVWRHRMNCQWRHRWQKQVGKKLQKIERIVWSVKFHRHLRTALHSQELEVKGLCSREHWRSTEPTCFVSQTQYREMRQFNEGLPEFSASKRTKTPRRHSINYDKLGALMVRVPPRLKLYNNASNKLNPTINNNSGSATRWAWIYANSRGEMHFRVTQIRNFESFWGHITFPSVFAGISLGRSGRRQQIYCRFQHFLFMIGDPYDSGRSFWYFSVIGNWIRNEFNRNSERIHARDT